MAKIKINQITNFKPFVPKESIRNVVATLKSQWIGGDGPRVKEFESEISKIIKNKNVAATNSGTSALQLALRISQVRGKDVITTPMTCIATNEAILAEGATPVWADINIETGNIDPAEIAKKITKKTKAIVVVHWGGSPADLDKINNIASAHKLSLIEDAAQALGSKYNNEPIGSHSDFVSFSLQAIKIINTIEGGILSAKNKKDIEKAKLLRWYGIDREKRKWDSKEIIWDYPIKENGYKAQMSDVSAAIGLGQLPYLEKLLSHRKKIAKIYESSLKNAKTVKAQKILLNADSNYWLFTVICNSKNAKIKLWEKMNKIRVKVETAHTRNDHYPLFKRYYDKKLPGVEFFNNNHLIIPIGHWVSLKKASEIAHILSGF